MHLSCNGDTDKYCTAGNAVSTHCLPPPPQPSQQTPAATVWRPPMLPAGPSPWRTWWWRPSSWTRRPPRTRLPSRRSLMRPRYVPLWGTQTHPGQEGEPVGGEHGNSNWHEIQKLCDASEFHHMTLNRWWRVMVPHLLCGRQIRGRGECITWWVQHGRWGSVLTHFWLRLSDGTWDYLAAKHINSWCKYIVLTVCCHVL